MSTDVELNRRAFWADRRFVVVDTETTGLLPSSRVLAFAAYVVENATTVDSWSTLINPGGHIGAVEIHGLTPAKLAGAKSFAEHAAHIRTLLIGSTKKTYLVGHNIAFDAARLAYEFQLLGEEPPEMLLLDNKRLTRAAGVNTGAGTQDDLAAALGMKNPAPHDATADALTAREIFLRSCERLIEQGVTDPDPFATWTTKSSSFIYDEVDFDLSEEHLALHARPMTTKAQREAALAECLVLSCPLLNYRIEDGLTNAQSARELLAWSLARLGDKTLTRYQLGLLADGAARTIAGRRSLLVNPKPDLLMKNALDILRAYRKWSACEDDDVCDLCEVAKQERCRFLRAPRKALWAALYAKNGRVSVAEATRFLFGQQQKPLGRLSGYGQVKLLHPDLAVRGAVVAARTMRQRAVGARALVAVKALWANGLRGPGLTELYAALEEDNFATGTRVAALKRAKAICKAGLPKGDVPEWDRVRARFERLERSIERSRVAPFKNPYNQRPAHATRFVRP